MGSKIMDFPAASCPGLIEAIKRPITAATLIAMQTHTIFSIKAINSENIAIQNIKRGKMALTPFRDELRGPGGSSVRALNLSKDPEAFNYTVEGPVRTRRAPHTNLLMLMMDNSN